MEDRLARRQVWWQTLIEMYSPLHHDLAEVSTLVERFQERRDLLPLKARGLKRLAGELKAVSEVGLPWKAAWRALRDAGYQGTYRQFVAMAARLITEPSRGLTKSKNLSAPIAEKRSEDPIALVGNRGAGQNTKPEWQLRREGTMAKLDREAEENRVKAAQLNRPKIFNPPPFKGRGED
jgi:hypothetical protein